MSVVASGDCRTKCDGGSAFASRTPIGITDNAAPISTSFQLVIVPPRVKAKSGRTQPKVAIGKISRQNVGIDQSLGVWPPRDAITYPALDRKSVGEHKVIDERG